MKINTVKDLIKHCGGAAHIARYLGITTSAVMDWGYKNRLPAGREYDLRDMFKVPLKYTKKFIKKKV